MANYLQEDFWRGDFGAEYVKRNTADNQRAGLMSNISLFANVLSKTRGVSSIIEFGPNIGLNLIALHALKPEADLAGIEINETAASELNKLGYVDVECMSVYDYVPKKQYDLVLSKGVAIHQPPEMLDTFYEVLYKSSKKYILLCEYYNPSPVEVLYHGKKSVLFKRDFAGEMLDKYSDLSLLEYGFVYHRDANFPQDDISWFLLEKDCKEL